MIDSRSSASVSKRRRRRPFSSTQRANETTARTSVRSWLRRLARRNMSAQPSPYGATIAFRLKRIFAVGRVKRANSRPLRTANPSRPTSASIATRTFARRVFGTSLP